MHQVHELSQRRLRLLSLYPRATPRAINAASTSNARFRAENIIAYQPGEAAKVAAPATISHTSLPSQNGAIVSRAASRSGAVRPTTVASGDPRRLIRGFDLAQLVAEIHLDHDGCGRTCARRDAGRASRYQASLSCRGSESRLRGSASIIAGSVLDHRDRTSSHPLTQGNPGARLVEFTPIR